MKLPGLPTFLRDAQKAVGAVVIGAGAALTAGLIDNGTAALITGIAGVVTTVVVYLLDGPERPPAVAHPITPAPPVQAATVPPGPGSKPDQATAIAQAQPSTGGTP